MNPKEARPPLVFNKLQAGTTLNLILDQASGESIMLLNANPTWLAIEMAA
jgi:hypothetical protein